MRILTSDESVKAVLINIFGGIVRCDRVAEGVVAALEDIEINVPLVVRLQGTNAEEGAQILENSGLEFTVARKLQEAAEAVVARGSKCRVTRYQSLKYKGAHDDRALLFVVHSVDNMAIIQTIWQFFQNYTNLKIKINTYFILNYKFSNFLVSILLYKTDVHSTTPNQRVCYADL